ncbi:MAG: hypothetical protein HC876_20895 [Chloroflexaceae bacterium]|nr:hypothetical protein [Chloroflexaceae bacterium]
MYTGADDQLISDILYFSNRPEALDITLLNSLAPVSLLIGSCGVPVAFSYKLLAYFNWFLFVRTGGPLDVKGAYRSDFDVSMPMDFTAGPAPQPTPAGVGENAGVGAGIETWDFQLSGNLLYGFVGLHVGFMEAELLGGAGIAQLKNHCLDQNSPSALGPGVIDCRIVNADPTTWDEPKDQAGIRAGMTLYRRYGELFLTHYSLNLEAKRRNLREVLMEYRNEIPR